MLSTNRIKTDHDLYLHKICFDCAPISIFLVDLNSRVLDANVYACSSLGYSHEEIRGMSIHDFNPDFSPEKLTDYQREPHESGPITFETTHQRKDGVRFPVEIRVSPIDADEYGHRYCFVLDIGGRGQAEKALNLSQDEIASPLLQQTREITDLSVKLTREARERALAEEELHRSQKMLQLIMDNIPQKVFWKDREFRYLGCNQSFAEHAGLKAPAEIAGKDDSQMPWKIYAEEYRSSDRKVIEQNSADLDYEDSQVYPDGSIFWLRKNKIPLHDREGNVIGLLGTLYDTTENKRIRESLIKQENILAEAQSIAHLGSWEYCLETDVEYRSLEFFRILGIPAESAGFAQDSMFDYIHPMDREHVRARITETLEHGKPYDVEYRIVRADGTERFVHAKGKVVNDEKDKTTKFIGSILDITRRKLAEERTNIQLQRLASLRMIDKAITGSLDLNVILTVIVDQTIRQMGADAANILILNHTYWLEHAADRGFRTDAVKKTSLPLGKGVAGNVVRERRIIHIPDIRNQEGQTTDYQFPVEENFVTYYGAPLIAKGKVVGVLEIHYRSQQILASEEINFLETLAKQTAIAVDNATLFDGLQKLNTELIMAYDSTLEGWSRALDLRDKESEGHSKRVTELAVRLAHSMGIHDSELIHIRRGAMLHDIGKMGIPDSILLKPGPLDADERALMERHPVYAFEFLSSIKFLHHALDIPYCHHEKWDGSGYPRGLAGDRIPLAARVFSIIDVWDALCSDRPYRPAWTKEKSKQHILQQSGIHFDPVVVEAFIKILRDFDETESCQPKLI
jgi:PAS domain S-box-containing protein/putative nucleotidyltransferase with HDIG domain